MAAPLSSIHVTSPRGYRKHPVHGTYTWHAGIDLRAWYEPVYSVLDGTVERTGEDARSGRWVRIRHARGFLSAYAHLDRIDVSPGQSVRAVQTIGISGNTGTGTGPHLHFRIIREGFKYPRTDIKR
jgi:murein DD-endopeptidase MepM/ murein hydrolase activator NlpD